MIRERHLQLVEETGATHAVDVPGPRHLDTNELFRALAPYVAAVALRILGRRDEVEDLVQDVFLDAYRAREKLRVHHEAKRWLTVVTVRRAKRRLYVRRMRSWLWLDDPDRQNDVASSGATQDDVAFAAQMYKVLDRLPVTERLAWTLRHVEGEELTTVAELVGCSLATAKRRIAAAQEAMTKAVTT